MKTKTPSQKKILLLAAILAPMGVLSIAFLALGVIPFGERNLINSDLYVQILPIMMEFKRVLQGQGSLFYSFRGGLGTNFFVLSTYQNASPLTWLFLLLFPEKQLALGVTLLLMVKVGLASGTMFFYLNNKCAGVHPAPLIGLSTLYALCGYVTAYYVNLMWLECVILLPLIVLGLRRLAEKEGWKLYVFSLAAMLLTSYYIGLMVCIFLALYALGVCFGEGKPEGAKRLARVAGGSFVSVMLAMVVLLPTWEALRKTGNFATLGTEGGLFYHSMFRHLTQLLPGSRVTLLSGPANLYSGLITLLLCVPVLFRKGIPGRRKGWRVGLVLFVLLCTNCVPLDVAWQLGHAPNGFPVRYSFVLSFLLVEMAAEGLAQLETVGKRERFISLGVVALLYGGALLGGTKDLQVRFFLGFGLALLVLYGIALLWQQKEKSKLFPMILCLLMLFECVTQTTYSMGAGGIVGSNRFLLYKDEVDTLMQTASKEDSFVRMELLGTDQMNAPFVYGYKGASIFASSVPKDTYSLLNELWEDPLGNDRRFWYAKPDAIPDGIANIRYYLTMDSALELSWAEEVARTEHCALYRSNYPTAMGYLVPQEWDWFFEKLQPDAITMGQWEGLQKQLSEGLLQVSSMEGNRLTGTFTATEEGGLLVSVPYDDGWQVKVDGQKVQADNRYSGFLSLPVTAGAHSLDMMYVPPGLVPGAWATFLTLLVLVYGMIRSGGKRDA